MALSSFHRAANIDLAMSLRPAMVEIPAGAALSSFRLAALFRVPAELCRSEKPRRHFRAVLLRHVVRPAILLVDNGSDCSRQILTASQTKLQCTISRNILN
jgi:hypothetical protein